MNLDNASALILCTTLRSSHKTKHINVRINFIREVINDRVIELFFVPSSLNVADILTKPLGPELFIPHRTRLLEGFSKDDFLNLQNWSAVKSHR